MTATSDTKYEVAGVIRCCIASLEKWVSEHAEAEEGTEVLCLYESDNTESGFVLRGRLWKVRMFDG